MTVIVTVRGRCHAGAHPRRAGLAAGLAEEQRQDDDVVDGGTSNRATACPGVPTLKLSSLSLDGQHVTGRLSAPPHLRVADAVLACAHSRGATTTSAQWVGGR